MFNDNIIRTPINGTAAKVVNQKNCMDEVTLQQQKDSLLDHIHQLDKKIANRKNGEVRTDKHKALGIRKKDLCLELSDLNKKVKVFGFGDTNRNDHIDCVYSVMKDQLTSYQYKQIIRLSMELYKKDQAKRLENKEK